VAYLVDEVRLNGEDQELIDEIVRLSKKYGIMTPYTSFLVQEDDRPVAAAPMPGQTEMLRRHRALNSADGVDFAQATPLSMESLGETAVQESRQLQEMKLGVQEKADSELIKRVRNKTFYQRDGVWVDDKYKEEMKTEQIEYASDAYFDLIAKHPELSKYLSLGKQVIVCYKGKCYEITAKSRD
jgi:Ca-activated chloride channel family protein